MTKPHDIPLKPPAAPYLITPQEQAVLDGASVTFRWEPVEGATEYCLEVASDTTFETLVYEETTEATSLTVSGVFPTDKSAYYWRVFTQNEVGESHGDNVESFLSGTAEDAARHFIRPNHAERLGPMAELMTGGSKDVMYLHSLDPSPPDMEIGEEGTDVEEFYKAENEIGVQHESVEVKQILGFFAVILSGIALLIVMVILWMGVAVPEMRMQKAAEANYPELREVKLNVASKLNRYEVIDAEQGIYRIPIDRAIDLMVQEAYQASGGDYSPELQFLSTKP